MFRLRLRRLVPVTVGLCLVYFLLREGYSDTKERRPFCSDSLRKNGFDMKCRDAPTGLATVTLAETSTKVDLTSSLASSTSSSSIASSTSSIASSTSSVGPDANFENCTIFIGARFFPEGRGLGNNMFVYASMLGIASDCHSCYYIIEGDGRELTSNFPHLSALVLKEDPNPNEWHPLWFETDTRRFYNRTERRWNCQRNTVLLQFYQSYKYFHPTFATSIREREFAFADEILQSALNFVLDLGLTDWQPPIGDVEVPFKKQLLIGIHARVFPERETNFPSSNPCRIRNAIERIRSDIARDSRRRSLTIVYLVVTNDRHRFENFSLPLASESDWVEKVVVKANGSVKSRGVDMAVLTLCDRIVIGASTSTFGWWAAYLSRGTAVYYVKQEQKARNDSVVDDYLLPNWIPV